LPEISAYACIESTMLEALWKGQIRVVLGRLKARGGSMDY